MEFGIGVDIGGTHLRAGVVARDGTLVHLEQSPMPLRAEDIGSVMLGTVKRTLGAVSSDGPAGGGSEGLVAIGVGAAGLVDVEAGVVRFAPNIGYRNFPARQILRDEFGVPVTVDNDATAAAYGEFRLGCGAGIRHMVLVTLGTGIGGGIVVDGSVYRGSKGFAGEIGHILVERDGKPCGCGQSGCWETIASGTALGELGREAARRGRAPRVLELAGGDLTNLKGEHVVAAAREGDRAALEILDVYADRVGIGLAVLANVLDPDVFVVGGGVSEAADLFLEQAERAFVQRLQGRPYRDPIPVTKAVLGASAGVVGAALIALETVGA